MKEKNTAVMATKKRAWLVDSSIYVFKAWFTYPDSEDTHGNSINAVRGFIDFVFQLLNTERPELIAFAFDESLATSHRKDIYPEYKANRSPAPESLRYQFRLCREFIQALGIHQAASSRYEADDLIGTWSSYLNQCSTPVNIITADKDLAQLVNEDDFWWEYLRGEQLDTKKITKRFGAKPSQIADQLAIAGDKSDNIPGVPGIGMSTAGKLLRKFDNLDELFTRVDEISTMQIRGAMRIQDLISEHKESIKLSRQLTGIVCDIEAVSADDFIIDKVDPLALKSLCNQLNLSSELTQQWLALQVSLS
ncbi:MAG: 5'-3' exonuclease H3TH domain-containing protein [Cocleimonas sp.]